MTSPVVILIAASAIDIPSDQIPGAIAQAAFPANEDGTPDRLAVARLVREREEARRLIAHFGAASKNGKEPEAKEGPKPPKTLPVADVELYLQSMGFRLELRRLAGCG